GRQLAERPGRCPPAGVDLQADEVLARGLAVQTYPGQMVSPLDRGEGVSNGVRCRRLVAEESRGVADGGVERVLLLCFGALGATVPPRSGPFLSVESRLQLRPEFFDQAGDLGDDPVDGAVDWFRDLLEDCLDLVGDAADAE